MAQIQWIWTIFTFIGFLLLSGIVSGHVPGEVETYHTCREDNVTLSWRTNITDFHFIDLVFLPHDQDASNTTNARTIIMSVLPGRVRPPNARYRGRLSYSSNNGTYDFKLVSVSPMDRGYYELIISAPGVNYEAKSDLIVYAEDNLWPTEDPAAIEEEMTETESIEYKYPFIRHHQSPVIGMRMSVEHKEHITGECFFNKSSRCEVIFERQTLESISSNTIRFNVEPQLKNNSFVCTAVKMPYDYQIKMLHHKLSTALISGICVSVFIAIAVCVITPIIIYINKNRDQYFPLKGGDEFLRGCISRIEVTPDISDVYRKNANTKMIHPHIQAYFQDPKVRETFFQDEGLTKIYFAAFIKHYIQHVQEPLIPLDYIQAIRAGEMERDENFNITSVREEFVIKRGDNRKTKTRKTILKLLFQHFSWFRDRKIAEDGSDSAENSPSKILTTGGLCGLLAMNFDRTKSQVDIQEFERLACVTRFLKNLVIHCDQIFGSRSEMNGTISYENSFNNTTELLLHYSEA